MSQAPNVRIHPTSVVSPEAKIGPGTQIWVGCQIREHASLGEQCILGKGVYVDSRVSIGNRVKIQNYVSIFEGVSIEEGVFVGPHVCFTNDFYPRAINGDGTLKSATDWTITHTQVRYGAAIGANSTIVCGVEIGRWAMVAAGSVVTRNVPDFALVRGNPARVVGFVCPCGKKIAEPKNFECEWVNAKDREHIQALWEKHLPR